jgi:hypothetical protein
LTGTSFSEAQVLSRDSLYNEFRHFVKLLEETHPDPYSEFGGKVFFHMKASETEQKLKSGDYTLSQYQDALRSFISGLHDGHTYVSNPSGSVKYRYIPLMLKVITDGIIIKGLPSAEIEYLGSRLISIDGISVDSLCRRMSEISPCENRYGEYMNLEYVVYNPPLLFQLLPELQDKEEITVKIQAADNEIKDILLAMTEDREWYKANFSQLPKLNAKDDYIYYDVVDKQTMYLRLKSVMAKENFLAMQQGKWPSFESRLKDFYQWPLRKEMPENIDEAVAQLPCFAEIFRNMLLEMRKNNTENLIIDLRDNGGGWTPIILPALYMMYGDKYLDTDMATNYYQMFSPLYMKKLGTTLEDFNKDNNSDYRYGEYSFGKSSGKNLTQEEKREQFVENTIGNGGDYIKDLDGKPIYTPAKIYVLTDAGTFSAAFHYAFYLWKMGAVVAGIPSAQAPNTFMEITEFELPYTKTKGSISNSVQYFLPPTDKRVKTFWPDMMPEYKDYKKYNFDQDAELLWLLDRINNK